MFYEKRLKEIAENHGIIFIYVSKENELSTRNLITYFFEKDKIVVVPKITGRYIESFRINSFEDLEPQHYGILGPKGGAESFPSESIDLFIIPGRRFDLCGNRKGHGYGYFDRFLKNIKNKKPIIGLCHEKDLQDGKMMCRDTDIPVDLVLTEKRGIRCNDSFNF